MKEVAVGILVVFLLFGIGTAESASSEKDLQNFDSVLGKWQNAEESRETPSAPWVKGSSEWEFSWMPGGKVIQVPGRIGAGDTEVHFLQVYGYDVVNDALVSWAFDSDGTRWRMTSGGWKGLTLHERWIGTRPDGSLVVGRCSFTHASDYNSVEGQCESLTDGKWWVNRKVKGAKVE